MADMMKRLILGIAVVMLSAVEGIAVSPPNPNPTTLAIYDSADLSCVVGVTPNPTVRFGERITLKNNSSHAGTIYQRDGFWNVHLTTTAEKYMTIHGAGTYLSACIPGQWEGPLRLLPKAPPSPPGTSFAVMWADQGALATWRYSVQYRIGQGVWRGWKSGTTQRSAVFQGQNGRTYFFRARTIRPSTHQTTNWSPGRKVVT
jgi:hypothetical protein